MPKISSTIDIHYEGCEGDCKMPKKRRVKKNPRNVAHDRKKPHDHHYHSEATSNKNRLFHHVKHANAGVTQTTNVTVNVEKEDDCLTSCFAGLAKCFGRGS